ncbi:MAG: hypothetical protein JSR72_17500 [Proteobacteria bacterium]|nr:hypothetical protein [Pseudomonadota bacterium]
MAAAPAPANYKQFIQPAAQDASGTGVYWLNSEVCEENRPIWPPITPLHRSVKAGAEPPASPYVNGTRI